MFSSASFSVLIPMSFSCFLNFSYVIKLLQRLGIFVRARIKSKNVVLEHSLKQACQGIFIFHDEVILFQIPAKHLEPEMFIKCFWRLNVLIFFTLKLTEKAPDFIIRITVIFYLIAILRHLFGKNRWPGVKIKDGAGQLLSLTPDLTLTDFPHFLKSMIVYHLWRYSS